MSPSLQGTADKGRVLALAIRSRVAVAGVVGRRVTGWSTTRPSAIRGSQGDSNRPLLGLVVRPLGSSISLLLAGSEPGIPRERKGFAAECKFVYAHARRFLEEWATGGSGYQCRCGATDVIGAFPGTTASGDRGAHSNVACPTN